MRSDDDDALAATVAPRSPTPAATEKVDVSAQTPVLGTPVPPVIAAGAKKRDVPAAIGPTAPVGSKLPMAIAPTPAAGSMRPDLGPAPRSQMATDATMAAPVVGDMPALPIVLTSAYATHDEIARGGMGRIVAATDQRLRRPVAIKELIEPSEDQLGRFQREAMITARLQHPGIVPVYEAGAWPSGEPFFAMKLVSGKPLDKVIAAAGTLEERLALLPRVAAAADAMAYAHSERVIHRDLKPANVLIGDFGETVVIDWGLAKDLDATDGIESVERVLRASASEKKRRPTETNATLTVAGAVMGTPAYMAPEQARGETVDERADVFALGAMLYHLLVGKPPYDARTATDVIAAAAIGKVIPLEKREPGAPADLVAIVHRAMEQEPRRRYANAGEIADELRRFMTGQLVQSHHYTARQRVARFVRKHQAAVTIASLSVTAFAVFGTLAVKQIIHQRDAATAARAIAEGRRVAAEQLIDRMLSDVKDRLQQIGRLDILNNFGGEIRDYYARLENAPGGMSAADADRITRAVDIIGGAQRDSGKLDEALKTWNEARTKLAAAIGNDISETSVARRSMLAHIDTELGGVYHQRGTDTEALAAYSRAATAYDTLIPQAPHDQDLLLDAAFTHDELGDFARREGKIDDAFEHYSSAKTERETASRVGATRPEDVLGLSTSHMKVSSIYVARGETGSALVELNQALHLREALAEKDPDNVATIKQVLDAQSALADVQHQSGDDKGGIQTLRDMMTTSSLLARRDPTNTVWKRDRANMMADLGFALLETGAFNEGREQLESAAAVERELLDQDATVKTWQADLSRSSLRLGDALLALGDSAKALDAYRASHEIREKLLASNPKSAPYRRSLAFADAKIGNALALNNDLAGAIASHEKALAARQQLVTAAKTQAEFKNELASSEVALGKLLAAKEPTRAATLINSGIDRAQQLVNNDAQNYEWKETVTQGLLARAELARATSDRTTRLAALAEAQKNAEAAIAHAPLSVVWPGYLAEALSGIVEASPDIATANAAREKIIATLEPLEKDKRLPAQRKSLLDRARR
ncbi:MAG TPA: protein kinase [Kofleriaceae bacterium]|jgi:serine/threonine protein kinase